MHIGEQKKALRQAINERIDRLTPRQKLAEGRSVARRLLEYLPGKAGVSAYYPLRTEADIRPLLIELNRRGSTLYLPVFSKNRMIVRRMDSLTDLTPGDLNIPEPPGNAYEPNPEEIDIALVPGRAFDRNGNRLGRGSGGFDRWLEKQRKANSDTRFIGVGYECQLVNAVPTEAHDQPMDLLVTARGLIECNHSNSA
mgnify:CR=1 FL=1